MSFGSRPVAAFLIGSVIGGLDRPSGRINRGKHKKLDTVPCFCESSELQVKRGGGGWVMGSG